MAFDKAKAVRAAEKHLAQGKVPAAVEEYRRIVESDAADFSALNTLGDLYARTGKQQEAMACFRRVAEHYREQGFALKAIAMYKKVTRFVPDDANISVALASLYEQQGLLVEARAQYLTVGDLLARRGNTREALEVLQRVADLDLNNTDIRLRLAEGFERESLPDLAARAYSEAADRLSARGEYERARQAYTRALSLLPHAHAPLQGLLTVHTALGTADEAADILEKSVAERPADLELRVMLVRAQVEAEDAAAAERTTDELVARDPSSYPYFFDVARLALRQKDAERAVRLTGRVIEKALNGREDAQLLELLEDVLRRDPEHVGALLLLARIYEWQRNDSRLRSTLERLVEAAEASGEDEEERRALAQLIRLGHDEPRYRERLLELGGAAEPEQEETAAEDAPAPEASDEVPTFESFIMPDEAGAPASASAAPPSEFNWEATAAPAADASADPASSFADLNADFTDDTVAAAAPPSDAAPPPSFTDFQEIDFSAGAPAGGDAMPETGSGTREHLLGQELESVDFYITQGYSDIACETLDMLERQYGRSPLIDERRLRVAAPGVAGEPPPPPVEVEALDDIDTAFAGFTAEAPAAADPAAPAADFYERPPTAAPRASVAAGEGLDPGLAAIFDEFREAVEEAEPLKTEADFENHYNLGLAYMEMDMFDQAVEAFQQANQAVTPNDSTSRYLQCCNMLGHCFMRKGLPKLAAMWFRKGLDAPGHTQDEYQALRYELGTAYEQMGERDRALDTFTEVYGIDVTYRGVADKLRELQEQRAVNTES
ncbi:MAG TPA: tetratricopeptide repeat protein [Pyrinomonadaceae bacterium]